MIPNTIYQPLLQSHKVAKDFLGDKTSWPFPRSWIHQDLKNDNGTKKQCDNKDGIAAFSNSIPGTIGLDGADSERCNVPCLPDVICKRALSNCNATLLFITYM